MKKRMVVLAAILVMLALCAGAMADSTAADLYDQVTDLLFHTDNVTLKVRAEFTLDGEWFKKLDGEWQQDRDRSFRKVLLTSPKADGSVFYNGYTIVAAGTQYNVMEVYNEGTYKNGGTDERDSILRRTVETEQLIRLGRVLAEQSETLLGGGAVTKGRDGSFLVALDEESTALTNMMLNTLAQFAVKRYFGIDYDTLNADSEPSVWYYTTITEGLMYSMRNITLQSLRATVRPDGNGQIAQAEGEISLNVETAMDGILQLGIRFEAEVSGRGSTMVRKFNPDDYGVVPAEDAKLLPPEFHDDITDEQIGKLFDRALDTWRMTGYDIGEIVADSFETLDDGFHAVYYIQADGTALRTCFNDVNQIVVMETEPHPWEDLELEYEFDPATDEAQNAEVLAFLNSFLEEVDPDLAMRLKNLGMVLHADRRYVIDGVTYIDYCEDPLDEDGGGVGISVRFGAEPCIVYYATISNG